MSCLPSRFRQILGYEGLVSNFDDSTNIFKIVCVLYNVFPCDTQNNINLTRKNSVTIVHVFGTNLWRKIPQVPLYPISGKAVFAHGCLHWLDITSCNPREANSGITVRFDVKEVFGLIDSPKQKGYFCISSQLNELDGEVGLVYYDYDNGIEVWMLKQKEWVMHCCFDLKPPLSNRCIEVSGCWNKDGDILMRSKLESQFFVYIIKIDVLHEVDVVGQEDGWEPVDIQMYQSSLLSIRGFNTTTYSIKH